MAKTVISVDLNTSTIYGIRVPPLTYRAHPFKPKDRKGSFKYGRVYESQNDRNSSKTWLEGASFR